MGYLASLERVNFTKRLLHLSFLEQVAFYYPTALKGCQGIVFSFGVRMDGRVAGKSLSRLYLRNRKV